MCTYTSSNKIVIHKRVLQLTRSEIIEIDTIIRAYPQGIVALVVCQSTYIVGDRYQGGRHRDMSEGRMGIGGNHIQSPTPCTYPYPSFIIWFQD